MNQKTKLSMIVFSLVLFFSAASIVALAKTDKPEKNDSAGKVKEKKVDLKNFEKPDKAKGETNAVVHKVKTQEVVKNLEQAAAGEEAAGNVEVSNQIEQVAAEQEVTQPETVAAIEEIEKEGKIKTFLVGTDYKNLGQLRSSLVQNRNQIRKLTQTISQVQNAGDAALLQTQLETLMQERQRVQSVIASNESGFSLFGWVAKFMVGYQETPINEAEENQLVEEVETAIDNVTELPVVEPGSTDPATSTAPPETLVPPTNTTPTTTTTTPTTTPSAPVIP